MIGRTLLALAVAATTLSATPASPPQTAPRRLMAVTIDDLPFGPGSSDPAAVASATDRMLRALRDHRVPAMGFVNEGKLEREATPAALLARWLDAGMTLGNHTYSHRSLTTTPVEEYERDVLRGEKVTRGLVEHRGLALRYFRHPMTHTGPTAEIRDRFEGFLARHGYTVAPFTIENADFLFARVYAEALRAGRNDLARRTLEAYLAFTDEQVSFFEGLAQELFGRAIPQVLLIHANELHADGLDTLLARLEGRGYAFVSLEAALQDPAYATPDRYVGKFGPSWLHRWSLALGKPMRLKDEPEVPRWIVDAVRGG